MIEKEYYRFDELEKRFNLTFSDLQYLVENSKIDLVFHIEQNKFIIGGWIQDKGFVGYSSSSYRGLVKITHNEQLELIAKNKINSKYFSLLNKESINNHNFDYPFETPTPHDFLFAWKPKVISEIKWDAIPAKLFPEEREHILRSIRDMFHETFDDLEIKTSTKPKSNSDFMAKIPQVQFYTGGINFTLNDICLLHSDLVKLGVCKSTETTVIEDTKQAESSLLQTDNPPKNRIKSNHRLIDVLLLNMLEVFPKDKPAVTWDRLKNDLKNEPRQFDTDEILDEVGEKELYWYDIDAGLQSLKRKSFYNLINKLKINE